ncbi:uncharacterized protein LOC124499282 [Dermatophagoides farinae]|uniref:uncharacterized protein LOC124499282 n=1 Tax=Dermatophagoides farinae TaxID=6954 RepID=UPI003F617C14
MYLKNSCCHFLNILSILTIFLQSLSAQIMAPIINPMMANIRPIIPIPIPIRPIIFTPISFHPIAATPPIAATFMNDPPAPPIPPVSVIDEATPFMNFVQRNFWSRMSNEPSSMFMRKWDKRPFMNDRSSNNIQRQPSDHDWYQDNNENNNNNNNNRDRNSRQEFRQRHWPSNSRSDHNFHQPINDDANDEVDGYDRAAAMAQMYDSFGPVWAESMNMNSMGLIPWHQFHHYHHHHDQHHHRKMFSSPADNPNGFQPTPILSPHPTMNFPLIANRFSPIPMPLFDDYDDSFTGDTMVGQASQINEHGINRNNNHNGSNNIIYVVNIDGRKGSKNNVKAIRLDDYLARNNNNNNNYNQRQRQPRFPWLNATTISKTKLHNNQSLIDENNNRQNNIDHHSSIRLINVSAKINVDGDHNNGDNNNNKTTSIIAKPDDSILNDDHDDDDDDGRNKSNENNEISTPSPILSMLAVHRHQLQQLSMLRDDRIKNDTIKNHIERQLYRQAEMNNGNNKNFDHNHHRHHQQSNEGQQTNTNNKHNRRHVTFLSKKRNQNSSHNKFKYYGSSHYNHHLGDYDNRANVHNNIVTIGNTNLTATMISNPFRVQANNFNSSINMISHGIDEKNTMNDNKINDVVDHHQYSNQSINLMNSNMANINHKQSIDQGYEQSLNMDDDKITDNMEWSNSSILNEKLEYHDGDNNNAFNKSVNLLDKRRSPLCSISSKIIDYCRVYPNGYLADYDHYCQSYFHCAYHNGIIKIKQLTCPNGEKFDQETSICRTGPVNCDNKPAKSSFNS